MNKLSRFLLFVFGIGLISACTEDYFEFDKIKTSEWRPLLALPLVNSSLTIEDILKNEDSAGIITTNPTTQVLEIIYDGKVVSTLGGEKVSLDDQTNNTALTSITVPPGPPTTVTFNYLIDYGSTGGLEIDSLDLKNGDFVVTLESDYQHNVAVVADFPGIIDPNGTALQMNFNLPPSNGISPSVRSRIANLQGYKIDMTNGGTAFNKIPVNLTITFTPVAGNPSSPSDQLNIQSLIRNIDFKHFYGYLGQDNLDLDQDTIPINLFRNFETGTFFLADPYMEVTINNSYGMPIDLEFEELKSRNPKASPQEINIQLPNNPIRLAAPASPGNISRTQIKLDKNNSNIPQIVSSLLKEIAYDAVARPNPDGRVGPRNYVSDTSSIGLEVYLRMPFSGFASAFIMQDTIDFEFDNSDDIENGSVRTRVVNQFPLEGKLQLFFADKNYNIIDSLYSGGEQVVIPGAPINSNGISTSSASANTDTEINNSRLKKLKDSKFAIIKANLETTNGSNTPPDTVKFLPSYRLDIAIGLKASILIQ